MPLRPQYIILQQGMFLYITFAETYLLFISMKNMNSLCYMKICESICCEIFLQSWITRAQFVNKVAILFTSLAHVIQDYQFFMQFTIFFYFWLGWKNFSLFSISQCWQVCSYAKAKKMKSLTLHIHGSLRTSLRDCSSSPST